MTIATARQTSGPNGARLLSMMLDSESVVPLHRQIYNDIRSRILRHQLRLGTVLPSTRSLAHDLHVSRNTVVLAYQQLQAEGYLVSQMGGGTKVSPVLPETLLHSDPPPRVTPSPVQRSRISRRANRLLRDQWLSHIATPRAPRAFRVGVPAIDAFPLEVWNRAVSRASRQSPPRHLAYGDTFGLLELREAIADYLAAARGARCDASQIMITCGSQQALTLAATVLLNPGDDVWVEDPGYPGARGACEFADARIIPVPVDAEGLVVAAGERRAPNARAVFVTPSRQLPLGMRMSLPRRLALLDWARRASAWIIEDDYDSEFRYSTRPLTALQGLDDEGCVLYTGTFSKVMFPSLRLGYLVIPDSVRDAFAAARHFADLHQAYLEQAAMAEFMRDGHFERHIREMRRTYAARQQHLVAEAHRYLGDRLRVEASDAGMYLIGWLRDSDDDALVARSLRAAGVDVVPLSDIAVEHRVSPGLLLGYSGVTLREITEGIQTIARVFDRSQCQTS